MLKKVIAVFAIFVMLLNSNVYAFNFPEPDWGALLNEKQMMVDTVHFGLYGEASEDTAPYYGAKHEPRGGVYLGAIAETAEPILPLGAYLTYIEDMNQPDMYYPANEMIRNDKVIAMIGWTINDLGQVDYDTVRNVLNTLNSYNKPMFIRFANEMNVSPIGDDPTRYVEIFRNVANMVHEYPNFAVVWSPNDLGGLDRPFEYFYPGDEYVDWVGVSCYMIKYFQGNQNTAYKDSVYFMTGDFAWATNRIKPVVDFMEKNNINKPIMISEGGVPTNNKFGENLDEWAAPRLRNMLYSLIMAYPQVKMINYFNIFREYENERYNINEYPYALDIFNEARTSGAYITEYGKKPEFCFAPVDSAGTLKAKKGIVTLHTLAHFPDNPSGIHVNYYLDGEWYHSSDTIPYSCDLDVSSLSDGTHTLTVSTLGQNIETSFVKRGNAVRFGGEPDVSGEFEEPDNKGNNSNGGNNGNKDKNNNSSGREEVKIVVNNKKLNPDVPPFILNGRTLVPLRSIFEALGAEVEWDDATQTVTAFKEKTTIKLKIGDNKLYVNGDAVILDVVAAIYDSRTFVPARAVSEALKAQVEWDESTYTVIIND